MGINANKYRDRYIKRAARVLPAIQPGVPFTPEAIDQIVGGSYSSKFVFYLRELGFQFSQQKDGRKIVSYTLISEPADAAAIRGASASKPRGKNAAPAPKTKAPKVAKAKTVTVIVPSNLDTAVTGAKVQVVPKVKAPKKVAAKKSVADIKAANLAKLKAVGQRFKAEQVQVLTEAPASTSFSIDNDWDSVEGLDLSKLIG